MGSLTPAAPRRRSLVAAALVCALGAPTLCPSLAWAQPAGQPAAGQPSQAKLDEARARYERGKQLYDDGAFDAALIELQRAYDLAPSYRILYNIGQVYRQQNDYAGALRAFERYLNEGSKEIDAKRRGEVEKEISSLKARVATLTITTNVPGAEVSIDDAAVGKTPLPGPVTVNAGKRKVSASLAGRVPVTKVITVAGTDSATIALELPEAGAGAQATAPAGATAASPPPPPPPEKSVPWAGWVATGVLAAGAAVTGVLALSASSDLKSQRDSSTTTRDDLDSARSKTRTTALVADVLTGAAVIVGGVTLYFTLSGGSKERPSMSTSAPPSPSPTLRLGVGPGSMAFSGTF